MTTAATQVLALESFSVRYAKALALSDVTLSFARGSVTAVTGPNGAGKSTLLLGIRGTVASTGGIRLNGDDVRAMDARERARAIAIVPQGRQLFPRMTVRENLQVMAEILRLPRDSVSAALDRFPVLRERSGSYAGVLSGGEQQMLAVSRSLLGNPTFLLLDEPMTGLAPLVVQSINETIRTLAADGVGVIVAEPAVRALRSTVDTGYVLIRGSVAAAATSFEELELSYQSVMGMEEREVEEHVLAVQDE